MKSSRSLRRVMFHTASAFCRLRPFVFFVIIVATVVSFAIVVSAEEITDRDFFRITRDEHQQPENLQTAIVSFASKTGGNKITVDLIAAVHIGEDSYYQELNKRFSTYDAVLFELIAPEDKIQALHKQEQASPVSMLQQGMKDMLRLEFQLDRIDYTLPNMVHADLTPDEFAAAMAARGDSLWSLIAKVMLRSVADPELQAGEGDDLRLALLLMANTAEERPYTLRRYLAQNFSKVEGLAAKIEGPKGSTIIADRNEEALKVLASELKKGHRRVAIFYGAAHMPDFARELERRFGLRRVQTEWLNAWRLTRPRN